MPINKTSNLASEAMLALFRAADSLRRHFAQPLAMHGISLQQYNVLRILRGAGGTLPTMEIRDRMMERAPGITRIVDGLVKRELVEREADARDRRQVLCCLMPAGAAILTALDPVVDAADRRAFAKLSRPRLRALISDLRAIESNVPKG